MRLSDISLAILIFSVPFSMGQEDCQPPPPQEVCDGVDNDSDDVIDEGFDLDGDGAPSDTCVNYIPFEDLDCNDHDPAIYPGAPEICNDGIDNDCDGGVSDADMWVWLDPDSPQSGASIPSSSHEMMRIEFIVEGECVFPLYGFEVKAVWTDYAESGWAPTDIALYDVASSQKIGQIDDLTSEQEGLFTDLDILVGENSISSISIQANVIEASSSEDDSVRFEVTERSVQVYYGSQIQTIANPRILGGIFTF